MPTGLWAGHAAPAVQDLFFFGLRVVHAREGFDVVLKHVGQSMRCGLTVISVLIG